METIADRIRLIAYNNRLEERSINSTLADVCDIRPQAVHQWYDANQAVPKAIHVYMIAKHFGVEDKIGWIISGEESAQESPIDASDLYKMLYSTLSAMPGVSSVEIKDLSFKGKIMSLGILKINYASNEKPEE
jgi:hypothetical protein